MYNRVLLTLDGSELSQEAIEHAASLAQATGAEIVLLQVIDSETQILTQTAGMSLEPFPAGQITADLAASSVEGQRIVATQNLEAARAQLTAEGVEKVSIEVREGEPRRVIVDAISDLEIDVVVMATRGRSGLRRTLLGSVANHVVRNADNVAVLLINPVDD
jgi:nucleotide-binding universal stress UspA family protein